jgi:signal peptidase II
MVVNANAEGDVGATVEPARPGSGAGADRDTRPIRGVSVPLLIAGAVVLVDQLTKHWAVNALDDNHVIDVVWTLRFNLAFNKGMAFSSADWLGPVIPFLAIGVATFLLVSVRRSGATRWFATAVGLVIGGSVGNVVDRLFRNDGWLDGAVVDFIDLEWWPIFNVADMGIVVGGAILLVLTLRAP